jgi:16S rRNA (guanine966-N2)-methyltransferase
MIRVVAGRYKGRKLDTPTGRAVRPTSDRAREAIFDILVRGRVAAAGSRVERARVLDAYCGTGALGLEALSQGAAFVTFMDNAKSALAATRRNIRHLDETARTRVIEADATRPPRADEAAHLVFLDPPYGEDLVPRALEALVRAGWIARDTVVVAETGAKEETVLPRDFELLDERRYGAARILFCRYLGGEASARTAPR